MLLMLFFCAASLLTCVLHSGRTWQHVLDHSSLSDLCNRCVFVGDYAGFPGCGLLRLHSTYRHDLKIYASDEGRVQMTAAAFAKVCCFSPLSSVPSLMLQLFLFFFH